MPRPYRQGTLDTLCGVYSVINAVNLGSGSIKPIGERDFLELFGFLVSALNLDAKLLEVLVSGCHYPVLSRLLKVARCWLKVNQGLLLSHRRPFQNRPETTASDLLATVTGHLSRPGAAAIIRLTGAHDHWTVVRSVGGEVGCSSSPRFRSGPADRPADDLDRGPDTSGLGRRPRSGPRDGHP